MTSTWAPFLLHAVQFLREGGNLAMVVPAEITQTHYGLPTLHALCRNFASVTIITFEQNLFREAQTETYLLLGRGFGGTAGTVGLIPLRRASDLSSLGASGVTGTRSSIALDFDAEHRGRFVEAFLSPEERRAWNEAKAHQQVFRLDALGTISNGYVTGANWFFHRTRRDANAQGLPEGWLFPAARNARSLLGLVLRQNDVATLEESGKAHHLVVPDNDLFVDPVPLDRFVDQGVAAGVDKRFKCRTRRPWWLVPGLV